MPLEHLVTKLLHNVQIGAVYQLGRNYFKPFDAGHLNPFLAENVDMTMRHNNETVLVYTLLFLPVAHKREQDKLLLLKDLAALVGSENVNLKLLEEVKVALTRIGILEVIIILLYRVVYSGNG